MGFVGEEKQWKQWDFESMVRIGLACAMRSEPHRAIFDDTDLKTGQWVNPDCPSPVRMMKTRVNQSKSGNSLLVTFHEGFSTYTITIPMPYAIQFFAEGLVASLQTLTQNSEAKAKLASTQGQKAQIQDFLRRAAALFQQYLTESSR